MSVDDLTIGQKLCTGYFWTLFAAFVGLVGFAIYYFSTATYAFPYEGMAVLLWMFFFGLVVWLLADFLEIFHGRRRLVTRTSDEAFLAMNTGDHDRALGDSGAGRPDNGNGHRS